MTDDLTVTSKGHPLPLEISCLIARVKTFSFSELHLPSYVCSLDCKINIGMLTTKVYTSSNNK